MFSLLMVSFSLYAKTIPLHTEKNENGEILVDNSKRKVEDRIHIENNTDSNLTIIIKGVHKKKGLLMVAKDWISAKDTKYFSTEFEDSLDDFKTFIITLETGKIISYTAEMAWSDLQFAINEIEGCDTETSLNMTPADELLKWKKLLDSGAITQEEFNAKKEQLLKM